MRLLPESHESNLEDVKEAVLHLIQAQKMPPSQIFMAALEGKNAEASYWTIRHLAQDYALNLTNPVGHWDNDPSGEPILPLHAAVVMQNTGALAALLELEAFDGGLEGRPFDLLMRMCQQASQDLMGVLVRYLEAKGELARLLEGAKSPDLMGDWLDKDI
jgi:hypothetical protein